MQFSHSEKENKNIDMWLSEHKCSYYGEGSYCGAIGGPISYTFIPTGIGIVSKVKCACGAELDITDYDVW